MHVFLSIGSNLGDKKAFLNGAVAEIEIAAGRAEKISSCYETEPVEKADQPFFLNCCMEVDTQLEPDEFLERCQTIEKELGRERSERFGPRTIDIDILLCGHFIIETPRLTIPHPRMHLRRFVLAPLAEIAPDFIHPLLKKNIKQLLKGCADHSAVNLLPSLLMGGAQLC